MTRDHLPSASMNTRKNAPTVAQVMDGLQDLHARLAFVRSSCGVQQERDQGLMLILRDIIDGLESAVNDLDVIGELATAP